MQNNTSPRPKSKETSDLLPIHIILFYCATLLANTASAHLIVWREFRQRRGLHFLALLPAPLTLPQGRPVHQDRRRVCVHGWKCG